MLRAADPVEEPLQRSCAVPAAGAASGSAEARGRGEPEDADPGLRLAEEAAEIGTVEDPSPGVRRQRRERPLERRKDRGRLRRRRSEPGACAPQPRRRPARHPRLEATSLGGETGRVADHADAG